MAASCTATKNPTNTGIRQVWPNHLSQSDNTNRRLMQTHAVPASSSKLMDVYAWTQTSTSSYVTPLFMFKPARTIFLSALSSVLWHTPMAVTSTEIEFSKESSGYTCIKKNKGHVLQSLFADICAGCILRNMAHQHTLWHTAKATSNLAAFVKLYCTVSSSYRVSNIYM